LFALLAQFRSTSLRLFRTQEFSMPIYAYKCATCGHAADSLQKMSDPAHTTCPACGAETYSKQLTAPQFQLKGSGWYVTDFRGGADAGAKKEGEAKDGNAAAGDKPATAADGATAKPASESTSPATTTAPAPATVAKSTAPAAPSVSAAPAAAPSAPSA
jgi:putative FmdB family regulatory protein